jgi:hypothetical protein
MSLFYAQLGVKRLALLRELLVSKADVVAFLVNTSTIEGSSQLPDVLAAAHAAGQQVIVIHASTEPEIDAAFATLIERRAGALLVGSEPFFTFRRTQIITLAAHHAIPAEAGGLMSYGALSLTCIATPVPMSAVFSKEPNPVISRCRRQYELVINLKTAKALGLEVPPTLLARADEVIE